MNRSSQILLAILIVATFATATTAAEPEVGDLAEIAKLEASLFDSVMSPEEVDRLLTQLTDPATRPKALRQLIERGQGHQDRLAAFANKSDDGAARRACAEAVMAMDTAYQTSAVGKKLAKLYREHAKELLPNYRRRFRKDSRDPRAVAMLISAEPDLVYAELIKTDRFNAIRYLLLRMRELDSDPFVQKHLFEHKFIEVKSVAADVFPDKGCSRIVGHLFWRRLCIVHKMHEADVQFYINPKPPPGGIPGYATAWHARVETRIVLFATPDTGVFGETWSTCIDAKGADYTPRTVYPPNVEGPRHQLLTREITCLLSEVKYSRSDEPETLRSFASCVPAKYCGSWSDLGYLGRTSLPRRPMREKAVEAGPELLGPQISATRRKPPSAGAPSLVILPPQMPLRAKQEICTAAELACDRLAQEIDCGGIAQVVDRTQLDKVLNERDLANAGKGAMLSYDAMLRLEVQGDCSPPRCRLAVIDLSTGNVLGEKLFGWPLREVDMSAMLGVCRSALQGVIQGDRSTKVKIRLVGLQDTDTADRMRSLAERVYETFRGGLTVSNHVSMVQHFEAGSAKEESLLLAMGLSRLSGGRQFAPQADATVEIRVLERDGVGKSYEETSVEIGVRLQHGERYVADWVTTPCKVKDFNAATGQAWDKLAKSIAEISPTALTSGIDDMATRRKQAEAELKAALAVDSRLPRKEHALAQLAHLEAGLKLDPTSEPAAFQLIESLAELVQTQRYTRVGYINYSDVVAETVRYEDQQRLIKEAVRYMEQFPNDKARRAQVVAMAAIAFHHTPLGGLAEKPAYIIPLTPRLREMLVAARFLLENSISDAPCSSLHLRVHRESNHWQPFQHAIGEGRLNLMAIVYRGMRETGTPLQERLQWLRTMVPKCNSELGFQFCDYGYFMGAWLAAEDGQIDLAKQWAMRVLQAQPRIDSWGGIYSECRELVDLLGDPELMAILERLANSVSKTFVVLTPQPKIFGYEEPYEMLTSVHGSPEPDSCPTRIVARNRSPGSPCVWALEEIGPRFYAFASDRLGVDLGYLSLDSRGRLIGAARNYLQITLTGSDGQFTLVSTPKLQNKFSVQYVEYCHGRLCVGTGESGLLIYDPKHNQWKVYSPQEGLPSWSVQSVTAIGDDELLCVSGRAEANRVAHYTLNLRDGKVKLIRWVSDRALENPGYQNGPWISRLLTAWRDGRRLMAVEPTGMWEDLLDEKANFTRFMPPPSPYGWTSSLGAERILSTATIGSRRFLSWRGGVVEYNAAGKPIRTWWSQSKHNESLPAPAGISTESVKEIGIGFVLPTDAPIPDEPIVIASGGLLVLCGHSDWADMIVLYDPMADTWYGPIRTFCPTIWDIFCGTAQGSIWWCRRDTPHEMYYYHTQDLIELAKRLGRVLTTKEYRERRQRCIESASPLDRIKYAFMLHQFDDATKRIDEFLKTDPGNLKVLAIKSAIEQQITDEKQ